jgi:hypothetical protein
MDAYQNFSYQYVYEQIACIAFIIQTPLNKILEYEIPKQLYKQLLKDTNAITFQQLYLVFRLVVLR